MRDRNVWAPGVGPTVLALAVCLAACTDMGLVAPDPDAAGSFVIPAYAGGRVTTTRFVGDLDLVWPGGKGAGAPEGTDRLAHAAIAAFPGIAAGSPGPGNFTYRVVNVDGTVHREIGVTLTWVGMEDQTTNPGEIRFLGVVTSDTKTCGGSGHGSGGCGSESEEGGCSGDDGGCSHDDGGDTHDDGGCSQDDGTTHDDGGGCSGSGGEPGGAGEPGGQGSHPNGSDCRIGQIVVGWAKDGGTPALSGDRVSWKWFAPDAPKVQAIQAALDANQPVPWPCKLCEKEILGGNLKLVLGLR